MSDFVGKYGQPASQGPVGSENFYADSAHTISLNIRASGQNQQTTSLAVMGPNSWSTDQTKTFCTQYLPSDAQQSNSIANLTTYHSSVGDIVLNLAGNGSCMLYLGQP